jgi:hypothetical protein
MHNGKEPVKVNDNDNNNNDEDYLDLSYEEKVMFLASKLCKTKMKFWPRKYHDINNKLRSYISFENIKSTNKPWNNILNNIDYNSDPNQMS